MDRPSESGHILASAEIRTLLWVSYRAAALILALVLLSCSKAEPTTTKTGDTVTVDCTCRTTRNPSECKIGPYDTITWDLQANNNPNVNWSPEFLAQYCHRHDEGTDCQCDDDQFYGGSLRPTEGKRAN